MEIISADRAYQCLRHLADLEVEEVWALALGPRKNLLASKMLFRGTVDQCPIYPRDVFRFACAANASSVLIAHNHPASDCTPSEQDLAITERLMMAGELLEIPVVDHLVISKTGYVSLALMKWPKPAPADRKRRLQTQRRRSLLAPAFGAEASLQDDSPAQAGAVGREERGPHFA